MLPRMQMVRNQVERMVLCIAILSLFFTITNLLPLSALTAITLPLAPLLVYKNRPCNPVISSLLFLLAFIIISTLCYYPQSFLYYDFYRRDGNIFISYAPLIMLGLSRLDFDVDGLVKRFVFFATVSNAICLAAYLRWGNYSYPKLDDLYYFLFIAHNAAGGFLSILLALSLGFYYFNKQPVYLLCCLLNGAGLLATNSRGSIFGIIGACALVLIFKNRYTKFFIVIMVLGQVLLLLLPLAYDNGAISQTENDPGRVWTITDRLFYIWPRTIQLYRHSPLIGTGFGSFNDKQVVESPTFANTAANVRFNDGHAHNSYLHFMAETGLVGMALLLLFLKRMRHYIMHLPEGALKYGLILAFWTLIISAFTEHRLVTPSQVLPLAIILGMVMARVQYKGLKVAE